MKKILIFIALIGATFQGIGQNTLSRYNLKDSVDLNLASGKAITAIELRKELYNFIESAYNVIDDDVVDSLSVSGEYIYYYSKNVLMDSVFINNSGTGWDSLTVNFADTTGIISVNWWLGGVIIGTATKNLDGRWVQYSDSSTVYVTPYELEQALDTFTVNPTLDDVLNNGNTSTLGATFGDDVNVGGDLDVSATIGYNTDYTVTGSEAVGETYWQDGTINIVHENGVIQQSGEEVYYPKKTVNNTASLIPNGTPVMLSGGNGTVSYITPAIADGSIDPEYYLGITTEDIAAGDTGRVIYFGVVRGFDTSDWAVGTMLYVSADNAGEFVTTAPSSPNKIITVAMVTNSDASSGRVFVRHEYVPVSVIPSSDASDILVSTTNFDNVLSSTDDNVQTALETIDDISYLDIYDTPLTYESLAFQRVNSAGNAIENVLGTDIGVSTFSNDAGYLTSYTETDPYYTAWDKDYNDLINTPTIFTPTNLLTDYGFTDNSTNWNTAYGWGNHADAGYLTSYTETDPYYMASSWYTTTNNSGNWNTAFSWGNHADAGYLTGYTETDPIYTSSEAANITSTDITNLGNLSGTNTGDQSLDELTGYTTTNDIQTGALTASGNVYFDGITSNTTDNILYYDNSTGAVTSGASSDIIDDISYLDIYDTPSTYEALAFQRVNSTGDAIENVLGSDIGVSTFSNDANYAYATDLDGYVTIATDETVTGEKTFSGATTFNGAVTFNEYTTFNDSYSPIILNNNSSTGSGTLAWFRQRGSIKGYISTTNDNILLYAVNDLRLYGGNGAHHMDLDDDGIYGILDNAETTSVVYYDTSTGELTYGDAPVSTNLQQTVNGNITGTVTHYSSLDNGGSIGYYTCTGSSTTLTVNIYECVDGRQGTIFVDRTAATTYISTTCYPGTSSTSALTLVEQEDPSIDADAGDVVSITYTIVENSSGNDIAIVTYSKSY